MYPPRNGGSRLGRERAKPAARYMRQNYAVITRRARRAATARQTGTPDALVRRVAGRTQAAIVQSVLAAKTQTSSGDHPRWPFRRALLRGSELAHTISTVGTITCRSGTRPASRVRSSNSRCCTRERIPSAVPPDCALEDRRQWSTCTGRTRFPHGLAGGIRKPSSTVADRERSPA